MPPLPGSKFPLLAIHKIISHIWEDRSRKVNNDEPDLRFFHGNFWPVISQAVRKPCFSTSIPRGPNLCILDFQTPPEPAPMKYFRKETLAVDVLDLFIFVVVGFDLHAWRSGRFGESGSVYLSTLQTSTHFFCGRAVCRLRPRALGARTCYFFVLPFHTSQRC